VSVHEFPSVAAVPLGFWRWPHFSLTHEWACKGDGTVKVDTQFMDRLEELRMRCGFALPINSGYRSPAYNQQVSSTGDDGPHTTGKACDIHVEGVRAFTLISIALQMGFTGLGIQQKGPAASRYIHIDDAHDLPTLWSY
jgi:uncharacterized protein YcbK (DUF882 family)